MKSKHTQGKAPKKGQVFVPRPPAGEVIEHGVIEGQEYRVWRCFRTGKKLCYLGDKKNGKGVRRNLAWLKTKKKENA